MKTNEENIIDQIQEIRATNNKNWMDIIRLSMKVAPDEAKALLEKIADCDKQINELTKKLSENI